MTGAVRILKRFIWSTMLISAFLLVFNFILLGVWIFNGMNKGDSPIEVVQLVAEDLQIDNETYSINNTSIELLEKNEAWAILINNSGQVVWDYQSPDDIPNNFSLIDVANFSKWYLNDYPVFVWEHTEGIIIVGYPKESFAKYQYNLPVNWVSSLPLKLVSLIIINLGVGLLLSFLIGYKLIRSIRPIVNGIQALGEDKEVIIKPKGILGDIAEHINRVAKLISKKNESLKARDEARSNWIAGISHDIRTPLSMILGYSSDLEENDELPEEQRRQASVIRRQAENLRSLVKDLNLVSLLEYEMQPLHKKPIRLAALVRQVASDVLNNGLDERYTLEVGKLDAKVQVHGDERLINRAITNLIQNCIHHNPDGCKIVLHCMINEEDGNVHLVIEDDGKGIPKEEISNLMELPYSSKRKSVKNNSHGLGLPMVARILKAHKGNLIITSDVGKGVKAKLVLPTIVNENGTL